MDLPSIQTKNILGDIKPAVNAFLQRLRKEQYIQGIVLLGGIGKRQFVDEYSDVDVSIFVFEKDKDKVILPFEFHYKYNGRVLEFNIHQQVIESEEKAPSWPPAKIEAYAKGTIFYDSSNRVANLIKKKVKFDTNSVRERLIWLMQQYVWRGQVHSIRAYNRGYPQTSQDLLNECKDMLLEAALLLNNRYMPHKKWAFVQLDMLPPPYQMLKSKFEEASLVKEFTLMDIMRRKGAMDSIYAFLIAECEKKYPDFPSEPYVWYYTNKVQIVKNPKAVQILEPCKDKLSGSEWEALKGFTCYNLITDKRKLLKELLSSNNIQEVTKNKILGIYKNAITRRNNGHGI